MRQLSRQLVRISLVLAVGAGLTALAASPARQKALAPGISVPTVSTEALSDFELERCLLPPLPQPDERPIGDREGNRHKKKIIVCG